MKSTKFEPYNLVIEGNNSAFKDRTSGWLKVNLLGNEKVARFYKKDKNGKFIIDKRYKNVIIPFIPSLRRFNGKYLIFKKKKSIIV